MQTVWKALSCDAPISRWNYCKCIYSPLHDVTTIAIQRHCFETMTTAAEAGRNSRVVAMVTQQLAHNNHVGEVRMCRKSVCGAITLRTDCSLIE